ncbi:MAG TPA: ATP synthase subunit I [Methylomirabilota bacterium]|nr:ATP synthase subunit I [Methylomirabilota bacterium]
MSPGRLTSRVTADACALALALAAPAAWLAGAAAALGVLAGGALALLNFRWLATRALAVTAGDARGAWAIGAGIRLAALAAASAVLLGLEWAHPVALLAGLAVLPCAVIVEGLRDAGGER